MHVSNLLKKTKRKLTHKTHTLVENVVVILEYFKKYNFSSLLQKKNQHTHTYTPSKNYISNLCKKKKENYCKYENMCEN